MANKIPRDLILHPTRHLFPDFFTKPSRNLSIDKNAKDCPLMIQVPGI